MYFVFTKTSVTMNLHTISFFFSSSDGKAITDITTRNKRSRELWKRLSEEERRNLVQQLGIPMSLPLANQKV